MRYWKLVVFGEHKRSRLVSENRKSYGIHRCNLGRHSPILAIQQDDQRPYDNRMSVRLTAQTLQLISLLIAPIAALAGVWLSPFLTSRLEQRKWIRDQRMTAYVNAIRAGQHALVISTKGYAISTMFHQVQQEFSEYHDLKSPEVPAHELQDFIHRHVSDDLEERYSPLFTALGEVGLYGSQAAFLAYLNLMA